MPSSLEIGSVWWQIPGHLEPLPAVPIPISSCTPHPYFPSSQRVSVRSQTAQMLLSGVRYWLHCSCHTAVWHSLCQEDSAYAYHVQELQTKFLRALHYLYQRENPINLISFLVNCRLLCT